MERVEKTVFLSYRRTNNPWALAIFQNLTQHGYDVFMDYSGIASGDFESVILGNITARAHFLVLLTPSALEHCGDTGDWLRREIETALASQRNIVPLMLEGFDFGTPKIANQLTGELAALKHYNGLSIPPEYFLEAMGRLRDRFLKVALTAVLHPASLPAQEAAVEQKAAADAAPAVLEEELTAQQWFERGLAAADLDEQLRLYTEAIQLKPDYAKAYVNRGIARRTKGDVEGALRDYNGAIRLKPGYALAYYNRGIARYVKGDVEGALHDYNEAIRLKPDDADAYYNRGATRHDQGDVEGALRDYNEAIRLRPDYADAYNNRGNARRTKGDVEGALQDFNEAIRLKLDYAVAYNNRGAVRFNKGDIDGAQQDYTEAIRLKPDYALAYNNRGNVRRAKGDVEGARQDYDEAARLGYKPKSKLSRKKPSAGGKQRGTS